MHWFLKSAARIVLGAIPLRFYRVIIARDVLVFLYHVVGPPDLAHVRHLYSYKSAEAFERDLIYLARRFRMVSYDEIACLPNRSGRPAAHITFDDGYAECDTVARPILLRCGVPCSFFVTTDLIDNRTMFHRNRASLCIETVLRLSDRDTATFLRNLGRRLGRPLADRETFRRWILALGPNEVAPIDEVCATLRIDVSGYLRERRPYLATEQIRRLVADGFTLGAHANRHVPLGSLAEPDAEEEIVSSCRTVQGLTGRDPVPFAFPHSADGVDRAFLRRLAATHPCIGRLFDTHRLRRDDRLILSRITADAPPADDRRSNLPALLRYAYREAAAESIRDLVTRTSQPPASDRPWGHAGGD
jgi:peptidoglycan/xylan/chitin deacetylase (PgdA/CDA1 family)